MLAATISRAECKQGCASPLSDDRFVRLSGDVNISQDVVPRVLSINPDRSDGTSFIVEFRNAQDAAHYRANRSFTRSATPPPGLEAPPGFDVPAPPGLEKPKGAVFPSHWGAGSKMRASPFEVLITNLPSELSTREMMGAVLQQAGLGGQLGVQTANGFSVHFSTVEAAEACKNHFSGCTWAAKINVKIVNVGGAANAMDVHFNAQANAYTPMCAPSVPTRLSPEADVFVPATDSKNPDRLRSRIYSDASTEATTSESEADCIRQD